MGLRLTDSDRSPDIPKMATDTLHGRVFSAAAAQAAPTSPTYNLAQVYEAHGDYVFRCLRSLGVRDDVLDDAFQDVFMVVQGKLPAFDGRAKLSTWLYAIVLRVARRYRERAAHEASRFVASEPPSPTRPEDELEHNEQLALARRALDALDDTKREVFVLAMVEQMSAPEIAAVMDVPVNTIYSRLRAARAAFSDQVTRMQSSKKKPRRSP
jgi:RNA polymerase sigma-70 factor, ECF subfamily